MHTADGECLVPGLKGWVYGPHVFEGRCLVVGASGEEILWNLEMGGG